MAANSFEKLSKIKVTPIYDPSIILKYTNPSLPEMNGTINQLIVAVTSLQQVVTSLVNDEHAELRKVIEEGIYTPLKACCGNLGVPCPPIVWDGSGVVDEGIGSYLA